MKYLIIFSIFFVASCSYRWKEIHNVDHFDEFYIHYYYRNPAYADSSKNYKIEDNRILHAFIGQYNVDSSRGMYDYFIYLNSDSVKKYFHSISINNFYRYDLVYDSSYTIALTDLDRHIFNAAIKLLDSLHIKNTSYLLKAKGFAIHKLHPR